MEKRNIKEYLSPREKTREMVREIPEKAPWIKSLLKVFVKPIVSFEPEKELVKIKEEIKKVPKGQQSQFRREKIENFKLKFIWQRLRLGQIQNKLEDFIEKNFDASEEQILAHIKEDIKEAKLDFVQRRKIVSAVCSYVGRHGTIKRYLKAFQKKYPFSEDKEGETNIGWQEKLFKAIFSFQPRGKIRLVPRPMVLFWRLFDIEDFARARGCTVEKAKKMGGSKISRKFGLPDLREVIVLENVGQHSYEKTLHDLTHEERHAIKELIPEIKLPERRLAIEQLSKRITIENLRIAIFQDVRKEFHFYRIKAKDEILAYLNGSLSIDSIRFILLEAKDGLYDYPEKYKLVKKLEERAQKVCPVGQDIRPMIEAIVKGRAKEYNKLITRALEAVRDLQPHFSQKDLIPLLSHEPIEKWPRLARLMKEILDLKKIDNLRVLNNYSTLSSRA